MFYKVKQVLAGVLAAVALSSHAELPNTLKVYTAYVGSLAICKNLFAEYDKAYGTTSQVLVKTGTTGMLAMKAMQAEPEFSVLCGSGVSDHVINKITYPGNDAAFDDLKSVAVLATSGVVFVTGNGNKFNTLPEMLQQGKEITVGYHSFGIKTVASEVLKNAKVLWVPHKASLESAASLSDGTLDLYVDGAGLLPLIEAGKLKSLGRINTPNKLPGIDLAPIYPSATKIKNMFGLSVSSKNKSQDIAEFAIRVNKVQAEASVLDAIHMAGYKPDYMETKEAVALIQAFKAQYMKQ